MACGRGRAKTGRAAPDARRGDGQRHSSPSKDDDAREAPRSYHSSSDDGKVVGRVEEDDARSKAVTTSSLRRGKALARTSCRSPFALVTLQYLLITHHIGGLPAIGCLLYYL